MSLIIQMKRFSLNASEDEINEWLRRMSIEFNRFQLGRIHTLPPSLLLIEYVVDVEGDK